MKILQVIPFFTPQRGGSVTVPYELSKCLSRKKHEVTILTTDFEFDEGYAKSIEKEGVDVVSFHCIANIGLFLFSPGMKRWLKDNIGKFDIVHMHNYRSYQNNVVYRFAKKFDVPYILQAHGSVLPFFSEQRLKKLYDSIWGYKLLNGATKLIAVSETEVAQYKQMGVDKSKVAIVPNGISPKDFLNLPMYGEFREKFNLENDHIVLFLGRLHHIKGIDFLVESFSELAHEVDDVTLVIVGPDDGYGQKIEKRISFLKLENRTRLIGYLSGEDKLSAYVDANVLVYPSQFEIFGLIPFEAVMCGTPVIVSNLCGCGEWVKEADCGYLVEYGNVNGLKEKIKWIIENPEEERKKVEKGKKYIKKKLIWPMVARKVEAVYENCVV